MKAKLIKIEKKELKTKDGKKFTKIEFTADVIMNDKGDIRTLKGAYSEEFARKYFAYCEVKTKDLIGKTVDVSLAKRSYEHNGETKTATYIKFLNCLNENGEPIFLPKENSDLDF